MLGRLLQTTASVLVLAASIPVAAHANEITKYEVTSINTVLRPVEVYVHSSDGEKYDIVKNDMRTGTTRASAHMAVECASGNSSFSNGKYGTYALLDFSLEGFQPTEDIPNSSATNLYDAMEEYGVAGISREFRFAKNAYYAKKYTKICNDTLLEKVSPQSSKYHVMADGFSVEIPRGIPTNTVFQCKKSDENDIDSASRTNQTRHYLRVVCLNSDLAKAKISKPKLAAKAKPMVQTVTFAPDRKNFNGICPAKVTFKGKVRVRRKGEVKYRFVKHDGTASGTYTLKFDKPGTKSTIDWPISVVPPKTINKLADTKGAKSKPYYSESGAYKLEVQAVKPKKGKLTRVTAAYNVNCLKPKKAIFIPPEKRKKTVIKTGPQ